MLLKIACTALKHGQLTDSISNVKHNLNFKNINLHDVLSPDFNHVDKHEDDREMNCDRNDDDGHFQDNMLTGKFVLSLEAGHKVSATAVDSIVSLTGSLISDLLQSLSREFCQFQEYMHFRKIYKMYFESIIHL